MKRSSSQLFFRIYLDVDMNSKRQLKSNLISILYFYENMQYHTTILILLKIKIYCTLLVTKGFNYLLYIQRLS